MTIRPFTPTKEDPQAVDDRTVGSSAVIDRVVERIVSAATTGNIAHTLLLGPRGAGKTHALIVAGHRAEPVVGHKVRFVNIPEDAVGIVGYVELLQSIAQALGVEVPTESMRNVGSLERLVDEAVDGALLVMTVENLDRVFRLLGTPGQHDFRAWVETSGNVMVIASNPMLFDKVETRTEPWFGSFTMERLDELSARDGADLLRRLRPTDSALADFLATPTGFARVQALHQITGGSPRLWTILAGVITIESLDELVPAVETLLEELVAYYQQRMWDLGPNEERLVVALATGPVSQTATDLATTLGLATNDVGTTLGRLAESRWIRGRKVPGTDQRRTWYELTEPLLRHYFQYRTTSHRSELTLVIDLLRHWFDPHSRLLQLTESPAGSIQERYLGAALHVDAPVSYDEGYAARDPAALSLQARRWIVDDTMPAEFKTAGLIVERLLERIEDRVSARQVPDDVTAIVDSVDENTIGRPGEIDGLLESAARSAASRGRSEVALVLSWLAAAWQISENPHSAESALQRLRPTVPTSMELLGLNVDHDLAYLLSLRDPAASIPVLEDIVDRREKVQWDRHPDHLTARSNLASALGGAGRWSDALDLFTEVADARTDTLGPTHPDTLHSRREIGRRLAAMARFGEALDVFGSMVSEGSDATEATRLAVGATLVAAIKSGARAQIPAAFRHGVIATLIEAAEGSEVAASQLPAELRPILDELRTSPTARHEG